MNADTSAHHQLAELEEAAEALSPVQIVGMLAGYEVGVADLGDDEYFIVWPNKSFKGLAHFLGDLQMIERLHMLTDAEEGRK